MREPDGKTLELLEWDRILEALAARTATPGGAEEARRLPWLSSRAEIRQSLDEILEAVQLALEGAVPDLTGAADLRDPIDRLRSGSILNDEELLATARTLQVASRARRALHAGRERAPRLAARAAALPDLGEAATEVLDAYTAQGEIADHASRDLRRARAYAANLHSRILTLMAEFQTRHADILQDSFTTLRDDRFVLPVRADTHQRLKGIVHGTSHSGATLFVEPESVVPLANQWRILLAEVEREEARIRSRLTGLLRERVDEIESVFEGLNGIDLKLAAGTLARNLDLHPPRLVAEPGIRLVAARHPLLLMTGKEVVPGDIDLKTGQALVISGPNSGGKTVALKTGSLCALMLRAGLPLPASAESEAGPFGAILADIGDGQSLDLSLSTFSARMVALSRILAEARAGDLVALDEVCAGTDPEEGAALAASVVENLVERGIALIVTTHFPALKELALEDPRMTNASVGYDADTFDPTFHLIIGTPGPSAALQVAGRCGVPAAVIERARARVPQMRQALSGAANRIHAEERRAGEARRLAELHLREAESARTAARRELREGKAAGHRKMEKEARQLMETVKRVRRQVAEAEKRVRRPRLRRKDVRAARKVLGQAADSVAPGGNVAEILAPAAPEGKMAAERDLDKGVRVWISPMHHEGVVLERASRGRVRVAVGSMQLIAKVADLRILEPPSTAPPAEKPLSDPSADTETDPMPSPENSLDLRGLYVEEAIAAIDPFLDRLLQRGLTAGFLIHGHGTGSLRQAVRRHVAGSRYVIRHRPGREGEGGDGITVVWIR